jgi:hypothetical protein
VHARPRFLPCFAIRLPIPGDAPAALASPRGSAPGGSGGFLARVELALPEGLSRRPLSLRLGGGVSEAWLCELHKFAALQARLAPLALPPPAGARAPPTARSALRAADGSVCVQLFMYHTSERSLVLDSCKQVGEFWTDPVLVSNTRIGGNPPAHVQSYGRTFAWPRRH